MDKDIGAPRRNIEQKEIQLLKEGGDIKTDMMQMT